MQSIKYTNDQLLKKTLTNCTKIVHEWPASLLHWM